jgi:hypothetical protein
MGNRKFSRVPFHVNATIAAAGRQFQGEVENLSMTGMFVDTAERLDEGQAVDITIALTGTLPEITICFSGKVSRIVVNGLAFTFDKIDLDSYMHLKNIIAYNSDDAEKVMEEICHSIDTRLTEEP